MVVTWRVGAESASGSVAYATYLQGETLKHEREAATRYYMGEVPPQPTTRLEELAQAIDRGTVGQAAALDELIRAELAALPAGAEVDLDALKARIGTELTDAATRAGFAQELAAAGGTVAELRPDLSSSFAARLGIADRSRPLTTAEIAHLMNNQRADGGAIEGRKKHAAHRPVAEVFGLDPRALPSVTAIEHVLAGRRADGAVPRVGTGNGEPLPAKVVESSLRKFKAAIGVPADRDVTVDQIARVATGQIDVASYLKQINATTPPVAFVDLTFSADKSVSLSFALAPTEVERAIWLSIVKDATADAMAYAEESLGVARRGAGGSGEAERAELAWIGFQHYTSRPAVDVVRRDAEGREFTDPREVPVATADPNLHQHVIALSSVLTDGGHVGALHLNRLKGEVKVIGAVFHAAIATRARRFGVDIALGPSGEARVTGVPDWVRTFFSRRTSQGEEAARGYAKERGLDWDTLSGDERVELMQRGTAATRRDKMTGEGRSDFAVWREDAAVAGYRHRSVLRLDEIKPVLTDERRVELARAAAMPLLSEAFQKRAVLSGDEVREIAARGLVVAGLGDRPADDIAAVTRTFRERGVTIAGERTHLVWGMEPGDGGKPRIVVTTGHTIEQERELVALVREAAADKSAALTPAQVDRAADRFLARNPQVDPNGAQWQAQREMAHRIGDGGRFSLSIGVAGSGKTSSVAATLVDAWHAEGRTVYGMTVPWKASDALREAGVDHAVAIEAFIRRAEAGQYTLDRNSVILADEVSMIGVRQQLALARLARETGAQLVEIGDPRQCQAVETPAIDLLAKAIGDEAIPKLLTSIRQQTARGREVAALFRDGRAVEAVAAMREDDQVHLVAGGPVPVIQRTTDLWRKLTDANAANPDYALLVMTPTNEQAREVGVAIRANRRAAGEIAAEDGAVLKAMDPNSQETFDLPVAVGDKLRMFTRTFDAEAKGARKFLSSNGDVVEVLKLQLDGIRVRNAGGDEGLVTWAQMKPWRAPRNDPVRVTYGYATTVDTAQSATTTAAILAMPEGSRQVTGYKAYTAGSRPQVEYHMVVSDAAERRDIVRRQMIGVPQELPREADVLRNLAANLGRFDAKRNATDLRISAVAAERDMIASFQRGMEPLARQQQASDMQLTTYAMQRLAPAMARVVAAMQQVQEKAATLWEQTMGTGPTRVRQRRQELEQVQAQEDELVYHGPSMGL
jgi:TrwC relaxase/AAA domain